MLIDSHAHLTSQRFDEDRDQMIARARAAGVGAIVSIGSGFGVSGNQQAIDLADQYDWIFATAGIHPHEADEWHPELEEQLRFWLAGDNVVAVGECGLDYFYDDAPARDVQLAAFEAQCQIAIDLRLPVVIHSRDAFADTVSVLRNFGIGQRVRGEIHFFTTGLDEATAYLDQGMFLGIPGVVTLPNAPDLVAAVPKLPLDRLLIETDSPYAAPVPKRGRRNEPAYVAHVADKIAELQGTDPESVRRATTQNAIEFFSLPSGAVEI